LSGAARRGLALLIAALLGMLAGWAGGAALAQVWAEAAPEGWRRRIEPTPYMTPTTYGPVPVTGEAFVLGHYEALLGPAPAESVEVEVLLPDDGELVIYPRLQQDDPIEGAGVVLRPGAPPRASRTSAARGAEERPCTGEGAALPADTPVRVRLQTRAGQLEVETDTGHWSCAGIGRAEGPVALQAGLRRVALPRVTVDGADLPPPVSLATRAGITLGGGLAVVLLVLLETRLGVGWLGAALAWWPLLLVPLLASRDLSSLHELLRMPSLPVRALPILAGVGLTLLEKGVIHAGRLSRRGRAGQVGALLVGVGLGALGPLLAGAPGAAVALFALTGGLVGVLAAIQAHARTMPHYNLASLVVTSLTLVCLEAAVRQTSVGDFWNGADRSRGAGTASTLAAEFEALAAAEPTTYPSDGYPVQAPPKRAPLRVVCLGGSSTGGAFQNDDIAEFYPARLAERLGPGVEVVNQGTGGWNTLHIALFSEQSLARLQPDVVTVYAGVNDQVESPIPYKELHAAWARGALEPGAASVLDSVRLFQGLRFAVRGLRGSVIGVPPADTADNLRRVVAAADAAGARTLLLSEAVQPRPEAFAPYWRAMQTVAAESDGAAFVHTAEQLRGLGPKGFLDQNHLSDLGHRKLAERLEGALRSKGWLAPRGGSGAGGPGAAPPSAGGPGAADPAGG
jgi:lysophospholipase L1-like esterase